MSDASIISHDVIPVAQPDRRIGGVFTAELGEPVEVDLEGCCL